MEAEDGKVDYQEAHWREVGVVAEASSMAFSEETNQERILAKLEPMESSYWLEASTAAKVGIGIVAI